jgi:hypothetical protein
VLTCIIVVEQAMISRIRDATLSARAVPSESARVCRSIVWQRRHRAVVPGVIAGMTWNRPQALHSRSVGRVRVAAFSVTLPVVGRASPCGIVGTLSFTTINGSLSYG